MREAERIARAEQAAERLFRAEDHPTEDAFDPRDPLEASAAVRRLGRLFEEIPGTIARALRAAGGSAELLSGDRLQGLAEIVQNAADAGASEVRLLLTPTELLATHDGHPVRLGHVLGFATPWLSTKDEDDAPIGRFGIGLMTLRSLSASMEVHCPPYHVRIGEPTVSSIDRPVLPPGFQEEGWTTLRVPLAEGALSHEELVTWLDRWDDAALLFLRRLSRVILVAPGGGTLRSLGLDRGGEEEAVIDASPVAGPVLRHRAVSGDGRSWTVYGAEAESPEGASRAGKATGRMTPVSVALPLDEARSGRIYAGLPVAPAAPGLLASAQFDPLASRRGFADNEWNRALVPLVADLWSHAALDLFRREPRAAWRAVPAARPPDDDAEWSVVGEIEDEVTDRARRWLASRLSFQVPGIGLVGLSRLAVEAQPLEGILTEAETADLAELPAALPAGARDGSGRWRTVLEDWRSAGADIPEPVSVERALDLLGDERGPAGSVIALAAVALEHGLGERLLGLPCLIASDGRRFVPPPADSPHSVAADATPLALQLGLVTVLHDSHLSGEGAAAAVLAWLRESGALLEGEDDRELVRRLAAAGRSGHRLDSPLTDGQVRALRDAFELMDPAERTEVGPDVGRAVLLEAFTFEGGRPRATVARPADAYLPRRIDRDPNSLAFAADKAPGLVWMGEKYADVLRSPAARQGLGAQRFLRLLGAETAPRVHPHPQLWARFSDPRKGLYISVAGGPGAREHEMRKRGATYTLRDHYSPDLQAVAEDIAGERRARRRRRRAAALLDTLGRAWNRHLVDLAEVESAEDYFQWNAKGRVRAYWLWEAGDTAWLDDESGKPRGPAELRIRTPGGIAVYGADSPDFLHRELHPADRGAVLRSLGVSGDPTRSELVDRLRFLRDGPGVAAPTTNGLHEEAAVVYRALAHDLATAAPRSDLSGAQLRRAFEEGPGLILTNLGWRPPSEVLAGVRIFRSYRAFAPQAQGAESLWSALGLREPSPGDCLKVIQRMARKRGGPDGDDGTILLETLRALASHHRAGSTVPRRRLSGLALWTSRGWARGRDRPVYATDDPILARGLRRQIPLWEPGGELEQFQPLLDPLGIEEIRTDDAEVIDPEGADSDPKATQLFRVSLGLLEEDLARNEPELAAGMRVPWAILGGFDVRVHPSLSLSVHAGPDGSGRKYVSKVAAKVDAARGCMFVSRSRALARVEGGGRALAELFEGNTRRIAQAWRAACDRAEDGIEARRIELARQRDERDRMRIDREIQDRTSRFREATAATGGAVRAGPSSGRGRRDRDAGPRAADLGPARELVDPDSLAIVDPRGRIETGAIPARRGEGLGARLNDPAPTSVPPQDRSPLPGYSAKEKEDVAMELVRKLLGSDRQEIVDLRTQRNVGADAIDSMDRFYELKVMAGAESDRVTLTASEVRRAMSDDQFFLVVVSGIEGIDARPRVRVFVDPLNQLQKTYNGSITLSGVRSTDSLVYDFAPTDG